MGIGSFARRHRGAVVSVVVVAVLAAGFGLYWFQPWKLFTSSTIDEALPSVTATAADPTNTSDPAPSPTTTSSTTSDPTTDPTADTPASVSPPTSVPPTEPVVLAAGMFVSQEHETTGSATVLQLADGSRFLRLENFSSSDGPDLHIWLTDQPAGGDWHAYDDGRFVPLGSLKATDGNQNYEIPADVDLAGLRSVVVWCVRFAVAFGSADLAL